MIMSTKTPLLNLYRVLAIVGIFVIVASFFGSSYLLFYWGNVLPPIALVGIGGFIVTLVIAMVLSMMIISKSYRNESLLQGNNVNDGYMSSLLDSSAMYIIRTDVQGNYTYANRSFLETFVAPEDRTNLVGIGSMKYIIPEDHAAAFRAVEQCFANPQESAFVRLRKPTIQGTILTTEWEFKAILTDGAIREFQCTGIDITERLRLEETMKKEQHALDNIISSIDGIVWEVDANTMQFIYISPSAMRMLGYTQEEWLKDPNFWADHIHPDDRQKSVQFCMESTKALQNHDFEYRFIKANGEVVWLRDIVTVESQEGKPHILKGIMVDITEQKNIAHELRSAEENFRSAVNALGEGIVLQGTDGGIAFCNARAEEMLGLTADQMAGRSSLDPRWRTIREDGSPFPGEEHPAMETLRTGQAQHNVVMGVYKPDGTLTWILVNTEPIQYTSTNAVSGVVSSFTDITPQKEQQERLAFSEAQLQLAIEGSGAGLWDWYVQSGVTVFNEQWAQIIGYSLEELEPVSIETWTKFGHPDDVQRSGELLQAHFRGETPFYECEARMFHKSGSIVWVLDRGKVVEWNKDGTPHRMTGTHLDITKRKEMEEQFRKSEEQFRIIAENTVDLIALHTPEGNYTYISPSIEMLLGYTPQEMLGKNPYQFFHPDDQERIRKESHELALRGETNLTIAYRIRHKNGTYRWFETKTQPLFATRTSDVIALQSVSRDVTERKRMEDELLYAKKLLDEAGAMARVGGWEFTIESATIRWTSETYHIYELPFDADLSITQGVSYYHPDDQPVIDRAVDQLISEGSEFDLQLRFIASTGTPKWVRVIGKREMRDGKLHRIYGTFQDITTMVESRKQLQERERFISSVLEAVPGGVYIYDMVLNRNVFATPSHEQLLGYSPEEIQAMGDTFITQCLHPDDAEALQHHISRMASPAGISELAYRFRRKDGQWIWLFSREFVFERDAETGNVKQHLGIAMDITKMKEAERNLAEANSRLKTLLEAVPFAIAVTRVSDGKPLFNNAPMQKMIELSPSIDEHPYANNYYVHSEDRPRIIHELRSKGSVHNKEVELRKPSGEHFWASLSMLSIEFEGEQAIFSVFNDITDRKKAEEIIHQSRENLKEAQRLAKIGSWEWDIVANRIANKITWSEEQYRLFGETPETFQTTYDGYLSHLSMEEQERTNSLIAEVLEGNGEYRIEHEITARDGTTFIAVEQGEVVRDKSGTPIRMFGTTQDITERKRAEDDLRRSEQQFRLIIESSPIPLALNDERGNITYLNVAFVKTFGYDTQDIPTLLEWWQAAYPDEEYREWVINSWQERFLEAEQTGEPFREIELVVRAKNGLSHSVLASAAPLEQSYHHLHLVILIDITERKMAEELIRKSEANMRAIFDASVQSHYLIDKNYRILDFNAVAGRGILELYKQTLSIGQDIRTYILPTDTEDFLQDFQSAVEGRHIRLSRKIELPNCEPLHYEFQYHPVQDSEGNLFGISFSALDITEQTTAADKLMLSEQRYRSFIELQGTYFVRTDLEGRYTYISPSMLKDYTKHGESVIGTSGLHHIIPEDHDVARRTVEQCLEQPGTSVQVILRKPHVSGKTRVTSWEFIAITDSGGAPAEIQCIGHDITARVEAEKLLTESEEKYRSMVHNIADIITLLDEKGNILYESSSITAILGYSETELIGQSMIEFIHPDEKVWIQKQFNSLVYRGQQAESTEFRFRHRNGSYLTLEAKVNNQLDNPAINAVIVNSRDITERQLMLSKLAEYSEELQTIIDSMLDGLILLDDEKRIVMVNPALVKMFGYTEDALAEMPLSALMPERFRNEHQSHMEGFHRIPSQRRRMRTGLGRTAGGIEFPIDVSLASFMVHDKQMSLAIVRDITEQQNTQEEIIQLNKTLESRVEERTRELLVLNNEKNEFLGIAAHDLKNPLAGILSSAEILGRYFADDDSIKRFTNMIIAASDQMLDIIANLLDINKIESGLVSLAIQPVDLDILNGIVVEYQARAAQKGIILHYQHPERDTAWVSADIKLLRQIFDNLISNAVKYSPHWKNVWVRVLSRTDEAGQNFGRVEVQDEGPGISAEDQKKLFHKFSRLTAQPTAGENSNGLGLSIVKKLVEMQHGQVWCESVLGQGATFILELPAVDSSGEETSRTETTE